MKRGLSWLVTTVRRSPYLSIAVTVVTAMVLWAGAWALRAMDYVPTILLSLGCLGIVLLIGLCVYVLVARVERNS